MRTVSDRTERQIIIWGLFGETGASSKAIVSQILFGHCPPGDFPRDAYDFNRCVKLLEAVPELRERLSEMSPVSKQWDAIVKNWDWIVSAYSPDDEYFSRVTKRIQSVLRAAQ